LKNAIKIIWNVLLFIALFIAEIYSDTGIYIYHQAAGQLGMLVNTTNFEEYKQKHTLTKEQELNLNLITEIKNYSVDSLSYRSTNNFTKIFDQGQNPLLWAITASSKYKIEAYHWYFPVVGRVSYKGFFDEQKAIKEKYRLVSLGYDVDLRSVSAWSTLGWFNDPVLSGMLNKSKGSLCNLIFHELFHATYYAPSSVDYNENLASFIAHKATIQFLKSDTANLNVYLNSYNDNLLIEKQMGEQLKGLDNFYDSISKFSENQKLVLKCKKIYQINASLNSVPVKNKKRIKNLREHILELKNAWFIDFRQYNGLQDSLEVVFNKFYGSDLRKMVQSLK
jgi:predicted aminopeptidase